MTTANAIHPTNDPRGPHVAELIEAYLAGGLTAAERSAFEVHVAACAACAELLEQARRADSGLAELFGSARPAEDFEDRLIDHIRLAPAPRRARRWGSAPAARMILHPAVRRAVTGVAAAVVLAAVGAAANSALRQQSLPFMRNGPQLADLRSALLSGKIFGRTKEQAKQARAPSNLRQIGQAALMYRSSIDSPEVLGRRMTYALKSGRAAGPPGGSRDGNEGVDLSNSSGPALGKDAAPNAWTGRGRPMDRIDREELGAEVTATEKMVTGVSGGLVTATPSTPSSPAPGRDSKAAEPAKKTPPATTPPPATPATPAAPAGASGPAAGGTPAGGPAGAAAGWGYRGYNTGGFGASGGGAGVGGPGGGKDSREGNGSGMGLGIINSGTGITAGTTAGQSANGTASTSFYHYQPRLLGKATEQGQAASATRGLAADQAKDGAAIPTDGTVVTLGPRTETGSAPAGQLAITEGRAPQPGQSADNTFALAYKPGEQFQKLKAGGAVAGKPVSDAKPGSPDFADAPKFDLAEKDQANGKDPKEAKEAGQAHTLFQAGDGEKAAPGGSTGAPGDKGATGQPTGRSGQDDSNGHPPAEQHPNQTNPQPMQRKIIRNGEMTFEVDSFDSSMMQINKIAGEEGGFVATTDSEKLANGKVKGTIIVRCPPERLDTLVLKLRALGELKSQKIAAQDITKQYTDLESQLRAAKAMEDRLLQIIKDGKGEIKDLLEAEKQLGVWREKIEGLEGEIRYYNNLVSLSTLTITLIERDIKTPYATAQTEQVSMGVETEDVEKARADAVKEIEQAKGRIIESELNKLEAGQFSAKIVADVPPDAADPLIDRLKTVGHVTRLDRERRQTSEGGTGAPPPGVRLERKDTHIQLAINNLANVAPRTTTALRLAAPDVEKAYKSIIDQVKAGGGRIVTSQLNRPKAEQVTGTIAFDVPSEKADVLSTAIRTGVEVMRLDVNENRDTLDRTDAKRGFSVEIFALASVAPRETTTLTVASRDVPAAFNKLLEAARTAGGRVSTSQLNEQNVVNMTGTLDFDVPRDNLAKVEAALHEAGLTVVRNVSRSPDSESTVDSKVRFTLTLIDEINLTARQTVAQTVATRNVPDVFNKLIDAVRDAGARVLNSQITDQDKPTVTGQLAFTVERADVPRVESAIREAGETVGRNVTRSPDQQNTVDTKVLYQVTVRDLRAMEARETITEQVAVRDVPGRYERVLQALRGMDAQINKSQLDEQNKNKIHAELEFTVRRDGAATNSAGAGAAGGKDVREQATVEKLLGDAADVFGRNVIRSQDPSALDSRVHYAVTLIDADTQNPRSTFVTAVEVSDVEGTLQSLENAALGAGGRAVDSTPRIGRTEKGETNGEIILDVPQARAEDILREVREKGRVTMSQRSRDDQVPEGTLSRARIKVTVGTGSIMAGESSLWDSIKSGLRTSATGLLVSLQFVIVGLCFVLPWVLVLWVVWRLVRRSRRRPAPGAPGMPPAPPTPPVPGGPGAAVPTPA